MTWSSLASVKGQNKHRRAKILLFCFFGGGGGEQLLKCQIFQSSYFNVGLLQGQKLYMQGLFFKYESALRFLPHCGLEKLCRCRGCIA